MGTAAAARGHWRLAAWPTGVSSLAANTRAPKSKNSSAALATTNTTTLARRPPGPTTARPRSGPALLRQVAITPGVEHQERPEDLPMIPLARKVLADEPCHRGGREQATTRDASRGEPLLKNIPERPAQPRRNRDPEALFPPVDDGGRKEVIDRALEEVLRRPGAELEPSRYPTGQLDQRRVEERRADLEGGGHGRAVRCDQGLVREIEAAVLIDHALDGVPERRALDRPRQLGIWIKGAEGALDGLRQEARLLGRSEATEEELGPDFGFIGQPADELLEQEVDAPVAGRGRKLLHDRARGAHGRGAASGLAPLRERRLPAQAIRPRAAL